MKKLHIISILVAASMFFSSCSKSTTEAPSTEPDRYEEVPYGQISLTLRQEGKIDTTFVLPDTKYIIVSEKWFKNNIMPEFRSFLFNNGIDDFSKMRNDCDDFARAFSFYVRVKFRTMGYIKSSPSVGDFYYNIPFSGNGELGGGHAINVGVFLDDNGNKVVRFIEPQTSSFTNVDEETRKFYVVHLGM